MLFGPLNLPDLYLFEEEVSVWGLEILPFEYKTYQLETANITIV